MKASGPFSKSESLSISGDNRLRIRKGPKFRETQYEWECGRGFDKAGLSQNPLAGARYRGRAAAGRRHRPEVADSSQGLRKAHPGVASKMGQGAARPNLAGTAHRRRPAMAQAVLWRGQAHGGCADAGASRSEPKTRQPGRDPLGQLDRARAADDGRDAGAVSGSTGVAGLFADEPGSRQTEIPV